MTSSEDIKLLRAAVNDCWKKTKLILLTHNLLTFMGNMAMASAALAVIDPSQLAIVIISSITLQIVQLGLGFFYYKKCHPWARLLSTESWFLLLRESKNDVKSSNRESKRDPKFGRNSI